MFREFLTQKQLEDPERSDLAVEHLRAGLGVYVEGQLRVGSAGKSGQQTGRRGERYIIVSDLQLLEDLPMREPRLRVD